MQRGVRVYCSYHHIPDGNNALLHDNAINNQLDILIAKDHIGTQLTGSEV